MIAAIAARKTKSCQCGKIHQEPEFDPRIHGNNLLTTEKEGTSILHFFARHFGKPALALCVVFLQSMSADAHKSDLTMFTRGETAAGYAYMIGGLVFAEQQAMERQSARYNLKLVFAPWSMTVSSPVLLLIGDNQGGRIESLKLHAPWFYIRLPPGSYTIIARIKEAVILIRDVYLHENQRATYFLRPR